MPRVGATLPESPQCLPTRPLPRRWRNAFLSRRKFSPRNRNASFVHPGFVWDMRVSSRGRAIFFSQKWRAKVSSRPEARITSCAHSITCAGIAARGCARRQADTRRRFSVRITPGRMRSMVDSSARRTWRRCRTLRNRRMRCTPCLWSRGKVSFSLVWRKHRGRTRKCLRRWRTSLRTGICRSCVP